jgi:GTP cyclohydrolase II
MVQLALASQPPVRIVDSASLPTRHGDFRIVAFADTIDGKDHVALVRGDVRGATDVLTRIHSECLTGDAFASLRCDCREQLEEGLRLVAASERGIVLYLRQEGRGIGLANKVRAYALQERGLDTVDANLALGFADDARRYDVAAGMLDALGVASIQLLTNNPDKVRQLEDLGVAVTRRVPHRMPPNAHNVRYLATKAARSGHLLG